MSLSANGATRGSGAASYLLTAALLLVVTLQLSPVHGAKPAVLHAIMPSEKWMVDTVVRNSDWNLFGGFWSNATQRLYLAGSSSFVRYKGVWALRFVSPVYPWLGYVNESQLAGSTSYGCNYKAFFTRTDGFQNRPYGLDGYAGLDGLDYVLYADTNQVKHYVFPQNFGVCSNCGKLVVGDANCDIVAVGIANGTSATRPGPSIYFATFRQSTGDVFFGLQYGIGLRVADPVTLAYQYSGTVADPGFVDVNAVYTPTFRTGGKLKSCTRLAISQDRQLFYTDTLWHLFGVIDLLTGVQVTIAGAGVLGNAACTVGCTPDRNFPLNRPTSLAVYEQGASPMVFIGEQSGFRIRVYYPATHMIETAAGNGNAGSLSDGKARNAYMDEPRDLTTNSMGLWIVEPDGIRFMYIRDPTTPTVSVSESVTPTKTPPRKRTRTFSKELPTSAPPPTTTTTAAPTTTTIATTTAAPTTTDSTTTMAPTATNASTPISTATTIASTATDTATLQPTTGTMDTTTTAAATALPTTSTITTTNGPPTPAPPTTTKPPYICELPTLYVAVSTGLLPDDNPQPDFGQSASFSGKNVRRGAWSLLISDRRPTFYTPAVSTTAVALPPPQPSATQWADDDDANATTATVTTVVTTIAPTATPAPPPRTADPYHAEATLDGIAQLSARFDLSTTNGENLMLVYRTVTPITQQSLTTAVGAMAVGRMVFAAASAYDTLVSDTLTIEAPKEGFTCRFADGTEMHPSRGATVVVTITPFQNNALIAAALDATTTSVAASGLLNPAAATGAQAAVIVGFMACATPGQRKMASNVRLLAPLASSEDRVSWMAASNGILLIGYGVVLGGIVWIVSSVDSLAIKAAGADADKLMLSDKCERWEIIAAKLHFPSSIFTVAQFLWQGIVVGVMATATSGTSTVMDVPGFVIGIVALLATVFCWGVVHGFQGGRITYVSQSAKREGIPRYWRELVPQNTWAPEVPRRMYAFTLSQFRGSAHGEGSAWQLLIRLHHLIGITITAGAISAQVAGASDCIYQAALVSALFFIFSMLIIKGWPYRRGFYNITFAGQYFCNGLLFAGVAATVANPTEVHGTNLTSAATFGQTLISIVAIVYTIIWTVLELMFLQDLLEVAVQAFAGLRKRFEKKDDDLSDGLLDIDAFDRDPPVDEEEDAAQALEAATAESAFANRLLAAVNRPDDVLLRSQDSDAYLSDGLDAALSPPRQRSQLERALGVDELPPATPIYQGDRHANGALSSPRSKERNSRRRVRLVLADDVDTKTLPPPPPPREPLSTDEAARILGIAFVPPPPPLPPPPPPPQQPPVKELAAYSSPFDVPLTPADLATLGVASSCATLAELHYATSATVLEAARRTARRKHSGPLPETKAEVLASVAKAILGASMQAEQQRGRFGLELLTSETARVALHELATARREPPLRVLQAAIADHLRERINDPSADLDGSVTPAAAERAVMVALGELRRSQRPTAETSLRTGMDIMALSGHRSAKTASTRRQVDTTSSDSDGGEGARGAGANRMLWPVSLQQAPLPFTAESDTAMGATTRAVMNVRSGSSAPLSRSNSSADSHRHAIRPFRSSRTVPWDSARPPTTYDRDAGGHAAEIVCELVERSYVDERSRMRSKSSQGVPSETASAISRASRRSRKAHKSSLPPQPAASPPPPSPHMNRRSTTDDDDMRDLLKYL
jgi:hypothetical protein